ncbi:helix-turn-helix transcriptional regulator [Actinopolymorpha pittospori]|uniref:Uncharacterized protein n=1 Tax=Actinopolymorpha pittospori TaxID=648752 RepID=A0A927MYT7_9ACTN|nr:helix-turn-helix domain-containing protein [Actinopolymorpha pittospori]MBE1608707.1 hypothetical protein [Actinopolymorpha pittospori]
MRSSLWRLRRPALPHLVALALLALAFMVALVNLRTNGIYRVGITAVVATVSTVTLLAGWALARRQVPARWRLHIYVSAVFAGGWLVAASVWLTAVTVSILLTGEYVLAARWWRRTRITTYGTIKDIPGVLPDSRPADNVVRDWDSFVAGQRGALPGARLTKPEPLEHGRQYTIEFVRGQQSIGDAINTMVRIAGGLGLQTSRLVVEDHPSQVPNLGLLKVMTKTPVEDNPPYLGPTWRDGAVSIGPYADWMGEAGWRLWTPGESGDNDGSAWSGALIGAPGSGKSRTLESIIIGAMWSGLVVNWFIDPQGGASSPALKKYADWYVDLSGAEDMLCAVERVAAWREFENATEGWTGFTPRPDRPLLVVSIDEAHEVLKGVWGKRLSSLARKVRKLGICFIVVSQYPGIETFGGDEALRLSIMAGNGICFRTASNYAGSLMAGLEMDPKRLPDVKGYGFTIRVEGFSRLAPFRNRLCKDPFGQMGVASPRAARLDPGSSNAAGPAYAERAARAEASVQASKDKLEAVRNGTLSASEVIGSHVSPARGSGLNAVAAETLLQAMGLPSAPGEGMNSRAGPAPGPAGGLEGVTSCAATSEVDGDGTKGHLAVLEALSAGAASPADIVSVTGYSASRVHQILADLTRDGRVERTGHGRYRAMA